MIACYAVKSRGSIRMNRKNTRRDFFRRSTAAITTAAGATYNVFAAETNGPSGDVVETTAGKIRGRVINKVHAFQGIPYGAPTGGSARFMPPAKPKAWGGVLDTVDWAPEAPQGPHTEIPE